MIPVSGTETPSTLSLAIAVARGVSTAIRDPPFSMPGEPRPASPTATKPLRTSVPHNTANTGNRCGLIGPPPATSSDAPLEPSRTGTRRISFSDQSVVAHRTKTAGCHHFPNVLPRYNSGLRSRLTPCPSAEMERFAGLICRVDSLAPNFVTVHASIKLTRLADAWSVWPFSFVSRMSAGRLLADIDPDHVTVGFRALRKPAAQVVRYRLTEMKQTKRALAQGPLRANPTCRPRQC